jgi:uncharacterized protein (DUF2225 family)
MIEEYLYKKEFECPCCGKKFKQTKVKTSKLKLDKRDSDFYTKYKDVDPYLYEVNICSHCGFSGLENIYSSLDQYQLTKYKTLIMPNWKPQSTYENDRDLNLGIFSLKLALNTYMKTGYSDSAIAKVCLRLYWLYRELDEKKSIEFLEFAAKHYELSYLGESFDNPNNELMVEYMIGELNRKLGNFEKSIQYFTSLVQDPRLKENKQLENLTRDQVFITKEEFKKFKEVK